MVGVWRYYLHEGNGILTYLISLNKLDVHKEIDLIKSIVLQNHVHIDVSKSCSQLSAIAPPSNKKWIRLPFVGNMSYKIARNLRKNRYEGAFYTLHYVSNLLNIRDRVLFWNRNYVPRLRCCDCTGQPVRSLLLRIKEHESDVTTIWKKLLRYGTFSLIELEAHDEGSKDGSGDHRPAGEKR